MSGMRQGEISIEFWRMRMLGIDPRHAFESLLENVSILEARADRSREDDATLRAAKDAIAEIRRQGWNRK